MNKISKMIKLDLESAGGFVIAESQIATTPQFANKPARVTIVGFDNINEDRFQVGSPVTKDAPSVSPDDDYFNPPVSGYVGTQTLDPQGQTVDARVRTHMLALKSALESASPLLNEIYRIDYMGFRFGVGHFGFV
jgi:hypothetical protein